MSQIPTFTHIPSTKDLFSNNGRSGIDYALVLTANMARATGEGYEQLTTQNLIAIEGPKGRADVVIMAKGTPISGATSGSFQPRLFVDEGVYETTGLEE